MYTTTIRKNIYNHNNKKQNKDKNQQNEHNLIISLLLQISAKIISAIPDQDLN